MGIFIYCVLFGVAMFLTITGVMEWNEHYEEVKKYNAEYGFATYKDFVKRFEEYMAENNGKFRNYVSNEKRPYSAEYFITMKEDCVLGGYGKRNIRLYGKGMVMKNIIDLIRVRRYMNKYYESLRYDWSKPVSTEKEV